MKVWGKAAVFFSEGKGGEEFPYVVLLPLLLKSISLTGELVLQTGDFLLFPCNSELAKKKNQTSQETFQTLQVKQCCPFTYANLPSLLAIYPL